MATANTTSPSTRKAAAKPAAKRTAARAKSTAASARTTASARPTQTRATRSTPNYAERAVLIPVGAALIAREKVVESVNDTLSTYSSPAKAQSKLNTQLNKFERRGITARHRLEREVRKTRTRVERELRQRRREGAELVESLQERVSSLV
ncbi:MAG TPA: hypothetical protein VGY76_14575 [Solirubrobacteraceae bacterium]|jgi:hypothetical protein|nr:hypothetical protein [Solirubrobacteraceae bacterium]